jgi:hypothetical protein
MKLKFGSISVILLAAFFLLHIFGCDKDSMFSDNYFSLQINSTVGEYEPQSVKVKNGITIIAATNEDDERSESVVITVNGDREGEYKQVYDYKTGVSVKSCGLTYKISDKHAAADEPAYYTSYEGELVISELDKAKQLISGSYSFYTRALDNDTIIHRIKGEFLNIPYN